MKPQRLGQTIDRERGIRFHHAITSIKRMLGRLDQEVGVIKLGHDPVQDGCLGFGAHDVTPRGGSASPGRPCSCWVSCTSSRISVIEITGKKRRNKKSSDRKSPSVP